MPQTTPNTLDEMSRPDWWEANPVYWLEIRQTRRNFLFFALLLGGISAGLYLLLTAFAPAGILWWDEFPLGIYFLGAFSIPCYSSFKLGSQLVHEDLLLQTPLRSRTILWGKLQVAMTLSLCVFVPSLPGAVVLAIQEKPSWLLLAMAGPILAVSFTMLAFGFSAGAKTSWMRGGMTFLGGLFGLGNAPGFLVIEAGLTGLISPPLSGEIWWAILLLSLGLTMLLVSSVFMFSIALAVLQRNRNLIHLEYAIMILAAVLVPIPLLLLLLTEPGVLPVLGFLLLTALYFGPPILVLHYVRKHDGKRLKR